MGRFGFSAAIIFFLQFLTIPFLGDIDNGGKLFAFVFIVLIWAIWFFHSIDNIQIYRLFYAFASLWLIFFVSGPQSFSPAWTTLQVSILAIYLLFLLILTQTSAQNPHFAEQFINLLLFTGVLVAILGLYEYIHFFHFGPTKGMLIPYLMPSDGGSRVGGIYGQPNLFAVFLTVVLLAFFYHYLHRMRTHIDSSHFRKVRHLPFFLVAFVFFLTGSRGGFLSLSLILSVIAMLLARGRYLQNDSGKRIEFWRLMVMLVFAFLAAKGISSYGGLTVGKGFGDVGISTDARFIFWASSVLIFLDNPWFGVGLGGFRFLQNEYGPLAHEALSFVSYEAMGNTNWAHNEMFQILSEGGFFAFIIVCGLLFLFIYKFYLNFFRNPNFNPFFLYSHLFLLPFIIQSMFSWPFRHPGLLILFFACLAVLLSQYPKAQVCLSPFGRKSIIFLLLLSMGATSWLLKIEFEIGFLKRQMMKSDISDTFPSFQKLSENPYSSHRVLIDALPEYTRHALSSQDKSLLQKILPHLERLCDQEGTKKYWYNLALVYFSLGDEVRSRKAVQMAINLMPSEDLFWNFLHYLNMLEASRETGKPLDFFLPKSDKITVPQIRISND